MNILEMSPEEIYNALHPPSIYEGLSHEDAVKMLKQFADRIYYLNEKVSELQSKYSAASSEAQMYRYAEGAYQQAMRSSQGIFG